MVISLTPHIDKLLAQYPPESDAHRFWKVLRLFFHTLFAEKHFGSLEEIENVVRLWGSFTQARDYTPEEPYRRELRIYSDPTNQHRALIGTLEEEGYGYDICAFVDAPAPT